MPATPNLALPYPVPADTADVPRDIKALADKLDISGGAVAVLPASPTDGQECFFLASAALGIVWHLRYRAGASGAYKWDVVGGSPLFAAVETLQTTTSAVLTDLATVGPQVVAPLGGDYVVNFGAMMANNTSGASAVAAVGAGAFAADDRVLATGQAAFTDFESLARATKLPAVVAAATIKLAYLVTSGTGTYARRWLTAMPNRVG